MEHVFDFIDNIYQQINIYKSVIVYDILYQLEIDKLVDMMKLEDYPITHISDPIYESDINTRIWVMSSKIFYRWIFFSGFNIENISVIFLIGNKSSKTMSLIKNYRLAKFNDNFTEFKFSI